MNVRRLGNLTIARIVERDEPAFAIRHLLPDATQDALAPHRPWLEPNGIDPVTGRIVLPVQTYVVCTRHHNVLIDTCLGENKTCRWHKPWHELRDLRFLADLATLGLQPPDIDFVICTHLHGDHVGWNTRFIDGHFVPTFPRARYVLSTVELDYWCAFNRRASAIDYEECIDESVLPIVDAGQALLIDGTHEIDDEVRLEPLPGHTPGHFGVRLQSRGEQAFMIGDLMHSPVQCAEPDWAACSDVDPILARQVRRGFLDAHADTDCLVLTAHFPSPSIGYIRRKGSAFTFLADPW